MPVINRHIINPDITYEGLSRDDLFILINKWKRLLVYKYGVERGNVVSLAIMTVNPNHIACLFAIAELGAKILVITKPIAPETLHATKMGIFGPVDLTITQRFNEGDLHNEMFRRYSKQICYEEEIETVISEDDVTPNYMIEGSDEFIFASTSGTTGNSKPVMFTHNEAYQISKRNINVFGYTKDSVFQHTTNMHHASSMLTSLFPSLMACDTHYYGSIALGPHIISSYLPKEFVEKCLIERGVDNLLFSNMLIVNLLILGLNSTTQKFTKKLTINVSGFTVPERCYRMTKDYPIEFVSHYGSIDTGIPLLVNRVTSETEFDDKFLGVQPDDFYTIDGDKIACSLWNEPRNMPDDVDNVNGRYYYKGRREDPAIDQELLDMFDEQFEDYSIVYVGDKKILVLWDKEGPVFDFHKERTFLPVIFQHIVHLPKQDFIVDTKVSMEQLRAYLEHHYAV